MKINKIEPIARIPAHHARWCGMPTLPEKRVEKETEKEAPSIMGGDLILYDKLGNLKVCRSSYKSEKSSHNSYLY